MYGRRNLTTYREGTEVYSQKTLIFIMMLKSLKFVLILSIIAYGPESAKTRLRVKIIFLRKIMFCKKVV